MNKTNLKCPRCHSTKLYKFGFDKQANQKYQCKNCHRQFILGNGIGNAKSDYPNCPKCGRKTYLHHKYKHYNRYKCGNRKCNHIIVSHHNFNIHSASNETITGSLSMKGIRFPLHIIITALTLYYLNCTSTRAISQFILVTFNIKVSHVTIPNWSNKFAPYFKLKANKFMHQVDLQSDDWHADETVIFINGQKYYLWLVIDYETRFIVSFHLSPYRDEDSAFSLINEAKKYGTPYNLITDR